MKLTYLLAFLIMAATAANAQQKRDTIHHASNEQKVKMKEALGLDKKQAATLKATKKDYKQKEDHLKLDSSLSKAQRKTAMKQLKKEKQQEVDAVLTPEQKEKAKALKAEKKKDKKKKTGA